jgi:predicted amidohydrolase
LSITSKVIRNLVEDEGVNGWNTWSPRSTLQPIFKVEKDELGKKIIGISGGGNRYCFGCWSKHVPVEGDKAYRLRVRFRFTGIEDPNLNILNMLIWRKGDRPENQCPQDYVEYLKRDGKWVVGEQVFKAPTDADGVYINLLLRFSAGGEVWWDRVELTEDRVPGPRFVSVTTVCWSPPAPSTPERSLAFWANLLDSAGGGKPDLVCLPEAMNLASISRPSTDLAESIPGPTFNMLAEKAKQHGMYICGCFYELDGDFIFNTAVLLNRRGEMIGKYRKVHPYWPEEPDGCSPGDDLPVFKTDFGIVGIMICYDSWFAETVRLLALKGADLILFPNAGYAPKIMPARAIDNNVYIVIASLNGPGMILDTNGNILTETSVYGLISAKMDLNYRPSPHPNAGGTMNSSPGGRRGTRNSSSQRLYREILQEIARWETTEIR